MARWADFEEEIRLLVEEFGYRAIRTPGSGDHGVDVVAEKNGRRVAVQVKLYGKTRVGNQTVQMLLGGMSFYDATEALIITTGKLTRKARELCEGSRTRVVFYEHDTLLELCRQRAIILPSWFELFHEHTGTRTTFSGSISVGRQADCGLIFGEDMNLSRTHFRLTQDGLALKLEDLRSSNGTLVNGSSVPAARLCYGDRIAAGRQAWTVRTPQQDTR